MKRLCILLSILLVISMLSGCGKKEEPEPIPNPIATITMESGAQMRFELDPVAAPNTVANFVNLANTGFYDGQHFFRVVSGVLIQGGDPYNDGTGDAGYAIKGEFSDNGFENNLSHLRGTISMSRQSHFDSASSQFFILQGSYPEYDGKYAAFGRMIDEQSLNTLDEIAAQPVDGSYEPLYRQVIKSIRVDTFDAEYNPVTIDRPKMEED
ncbi:MAG: peptidylprolyl isomerase [Clostridia bacterium]|nr:peptidylprolyl isomerase [Clostridia bacterium]